MNRLDGRRVRVAHEAVFDVVVVGSGPAGAAVARSAAAAGARVAVVEEGEWAEPAAFPLDSFQAHARYYRGLGTTLLLGPAPMPYVQGRAVGGTSLVNGAICWRLPRDVYDEWVAADPRLGEALPWGEVDEALDRVEADLGVAPTEDAVAGPKNRLMARGAEALGLAHRPIRRNVRGCRGLGRCLQGCPEGHKLSMDRSYLLDAERDGAHVLSSVRVRRIRLEADAAGGVEGVAAGGGRVALRAQRAVVLAASAVQTPALLLQSGVRHGPVGRNFQCHPGVAVGGRFREPVRSWEGATQGHEVTGLRGEGLKFEVLGFGLSILASRLPGVGRALARSIDDMAHWTSWGAAVRAEGRGRVQVLGGRTLVSFRPTPRDVARFRRGVQVLGEMLLAAGAEYVTPGVHGWDERVSERRRMAELPASGPQRPGAYAAAVTHMFSTCRMGSDPAHNVVRPDFRHHLCERLYVADSSVFPTNLGVNPQIPILALATLCGRRVVA